MFVDCGAVNAGSATSEQMQALGHELAHLTNKGLDELLAVDRCAAVTPFLCAACSALDPVPLFGLCLGFSFELSCDLMEVAHCHLLGSKRVEYRDPHCHQGG